MFCRIIENHDHYRRLRRKKTRQERSLYGKIYSVYVASVIASPLIMGSLTSHCNGGLMNINYVGIITDRGNRKIGGGGKSAQIISCSRNRTY